MISISASELHALEDKVAILTDTLKDVTGANLLLPREWHLSPCEARIIKALAPGKLMTCEQLLTSLCWQRRLRDEDEPDVQIVKCFVCKIRSKIGHDAIITHWGRGYTLAEPWRLKIESLATH